MLLKRNCAFRANGKGGGSSCSELSSEDKMYIGIIAALCAVVLAACASWVLIKNHLSRRSAAREAALNGSGIEPEMGQYGRAPLLSAASQYATSHHMTAAPMGSPSMSISEGPYSPYADSHSSHSHSSHSHSSYSYGSRTPSEFHFPILSADGHLLPPAPASARMEDAERPLPEPPALQALAPTSPMANEQSEGRGAGANRNRLVGLWPESLSLSRTNAYQHPSGNEKMDYQYSPEHEYKEYPSYASRPSSVMSTPRLSPGLEYGQVQPHRAVVHRSFSSEGQEYDLGVRR